MSICPSMTINPTYTPAAPLPRDYTWGCPPGYLCKPKHVGADAGCNFEAGLPADTYVCSPDQCIESPPFIHKQFWGEPGESDKVAPTYNVSKDYFNLNPELFRLDYSIFKYPENPADLDHYYKRSFGSRFRGKLQSRQSITDVPPECFDECNDAALEVQSTGKTEKICRANSVFKRSLGSCTKCSNRERSGGFDQVVLPNFQQFLNYCEDQSSGTSSAAGITQGSTQSSSQTATTSASKTTAESGSHSTISSTSASSSASTTDTLATSSGPETTGTASTSSSRSATTDTSDRAASQGSTTTGDAPRSSSRTLSTDSTFSATDSTRVTAPSTGTTSGATRTASSSFGSGSTSTFTHSDATTETGASETISTTSGDRTTSATGSTVGGPSSGTDTMNTASDSAGATATDSDEAPLATGAAMNLQVWSHWSALAPIIAWTILLA